MIIFLLEQNVSHGQQNQSEGKVNPMTGNKGQTRGRSDYRTKIYKAQRYKQLQSHIYQTNNRMRHLQFIGHQLVGVLAMRLSQVLVQQDAMAYGKASIHAIDQQEYEICHVARSENERAYEEEQDICHSDLAYVPGEAFGLSLRAEVEAAENDVCKRNYGNQEFVRKAKFLVQKEQRQQGSHGICSCDAVHPIHEVDDVGGSYTDYHCYEDYPPHVPVEHVQLIEHQGHCRELCYKPDAVRQGVDVVDEAYSGDKGDGDKAPDVMEAEEGWLGLSMMLHLSAMRKYTNSAARSRAVINKYLS